MAKRSFCELLESRRLLSTYFVNGTAGNDSVSIEDDSSAGLYVNGSFVPSSGVTDIQVNGLDGADSLVIYNSWRPIVFNGGNGNDVLTLSGGDLGHLAGQTTFNGGAGTDAATLNDNINTDNTTYAFSGNSFDRVGYGHLIFDPAVEALAVYTGFGSNAIYVNSLSAAQQIVIQGTTGSDAAYVDMTGSGSTVSFTGGGGAGYDALQVSDYNRTTSSTYTVSSISLSNATRVVNYSGAESVQLQGSGTAGCTYNIQSSALPSPLNILGGAGNDVFNVTAFTASSTTLLGTVNVSGQGGSDSLTINCTAWSSAALTFYLTANSFSFNTPAALLSYSGMASLTLNGPAQATTSNCSYIVTSTAASITGQTTITAGTGNNSITIRPRDAMGNLKIATPLGVFGGAGSDSFTIDDTGATSGVNYTINNAGGASTCDVFGLGAAAVGAFSDVENIYINAGDANDTFALNSFSSGSALIVNSGAGLDEFDVSPVAHNLPATITNMSYFSYDGGTPAGSDGDHFDIINYENTSAWTINRSSTNIVYSTSGYTLVIYLSHLGYLYASGGTQGDSFNILSTPADNMNNDMYGAGGSDTYNIGLLGLTSGIRSYVNIDGYGGNSQVTVDDSADTVGRTFHMDDRFINSEPTDTLFPSVSADIYGVIALESVSGFITVKLGSGPDTIYAAPNPTATYLIQANNPTTLPGDTLTLAFAAAVNPVFTPQGTGTGTYTFSNRQPLKYTGVETKTIDDVPPWVTSDQFIYDAVAPATHAILFEFSEDVQTGLYWQRFYLQNTTTSQSFDESDVAVNYDSSMNFAYYTFPGLPNGVLPDGDYHAVLSRVHDQAGNVQAVDATLDFFVMTADANHDRSVDTVDFNILTANFGQSGKTFGQGDFNYDGSVDTVDFNLLAGKFGSTLAAEPSSAAAASPPAAAPHSVFNGLGLIAPSDHSISELLA